MQSKGREFPIGKVKKTILADKADYYILIYFNTGEEDKKYGSQLDEEENKYAFKLNVDPAMSLNSILRLIQDKKIPLAKRLNIKVMGNHDAMNIETLEAIPVKNRKFGEHSLVDVCKILSKIIKITKAEQTKINLHGSETGIIPPLKEIYPSLCAVEKTYAGTAKISTARMSLTLETSFSTMGFIAQELKEAALKNITISGVNGILMTDEGKTRGVLSKSMYDNKITFFEKQELIAKLKPAIESYNTDMLLTLEADNALMHVRKSTIKI